MHDFGGTSWQTQRHSRKQWRRIVSIALASSALFFTSFAGTHYLSQSSITATAFPHTSRVAVASGHGGALHAFYRDKDTKWLLHAHQTKPGGSWTTFRSMGGCIAGNPTAIRNADGRVQVFARSCGDNLITRFEIKSGGDWSNWHDLGGNVQDDPVAAADKDGSIDVFAANSKSAISLIRQTSPSGKFGAWKSLGGCVTGLGALRASSGTLLVAGRKCDGTVVTLSQTTPNGGFGGSWTSLGGAVVGSPALAKNSDGTLSVFVTAKNCSILEAHQSTPGGALSSFSSLGGCSGHSPAAVAASKGVQVFINSNNVAFRAVRTGTTFTKFSTLGGTCIGAPSAHRDADNNAVVFCQTKSYGIHIQVEKIGSRTAWVAPGIGKDLKRLIDIRDNYINPLEGGSWDRWRIDQGVDWKPNTNDPVRAIGNAVITYSSTHNWYWPGSACINYKLTDGPMAGQHIYVAEHMTGLAPVGSHVKKGQRIGTALPGYPWTEWGYAAASDCVPAIRYHAGCGEGYATTGGLAMARFMKEIGVTQEMGTNTLSDPGDGPDVPYWGTCKRNGT